MISPDWNQPASRFRLVGRNEATTFTGFCNHHDTSVLREIDVPWEPADADRLVALHALRAAAREYWAKLNVIESFVLVLSYYRAGRIEALADHFGLTPEEIPRHPEIVEFWRIVLSAYRSGAKRMEARFGSLRHQVENRDYHLTIADVYEFSGPPKIGAALWASPELDFHDVQVVVPKVTGHLPDLAVCVIPELDRTIATLSFHRQDRQVLGSLLAQVREMSEAERRFALSWFLVINGENVVFAPDYVGSLPPTTIALIEEIFFKTIHSSCPYRDLAPIDFF